MMNETRPQPLIVAFVADLMFMTKIGNVAKHLNYRLQWVESAAQIGEGDQGVSAESMGEQLHGLDGQLFKKITTWQPSLLLFDLANDAVPWRKWIAILKSSAATRRIPIMAFGPHTDVAVMKAAKEAGADPVLARSAFTAGMPELLEKHIRPPDFAAVAEACREALPPLVVRGLKKFNQGQYYACHDDLEAAWRGELGPGRDLYRGILQVGIAYYQIERGNYRGAVKMLLRVRQWLNSLPAICQGVDVAGLRADISAVQAALTKLGPENIGQFDRRLFRPVKFQS